MPRFGESEFQATMTAYSSTALNIQQTGARQIQINTRQFNADIGSLLYSEDKKDFTFKVLNKELRAHKLILSARSPVLKKLFESDTAESPLNSIEIEDVSFEAIKAFLEFIYSDEYTNEHEQLSPQLLHLGDKYELINLKYNAANTLIRTLNANNAIDLLDLFDRYNITELKQEVVYFITKNTETAYTNEKKLELKSTHPHLFDLIETTIYVINRPQPNLNDPKNELVDKN